ncbi:glycogen debranching protein GlgX [Amycolatopsis sp. QT-25]|uniref:glycogen debranching protein GlgX n=1 Tax=Amycolatopsis sp. QT-25 TaxID=3034022 RepID=UPI0023EB5511|nr:glycogen debranching protein GlgX [Amycolatopsis sp. QT-25]WET77099.1 glycogen debranching protein GlgX [Amycolatopsis sp. QT-25]
MATRPSVDHVLAGRPFPLGAHAEAGGVRFAITSAVADFVELCLIDTDGSERRIALTERTFGVWHGLVPGVTPGQRYGYRVHGPYEPARGLRCNPNKLLVDPYARQITGALTDLRAARGFTGDPDRGRMSTVDSLGSVPLSVVTSPGGPDTGTKPEVPFEEAVIYELHVKGFTEQHPFIPESLRGTYLGLAHPVAIEYLTRLGVTSVELLPVHWFQDEPALIRNGRHNYWGYSPLGYFAPHAAYASEPGREIEEFRLMVAALHAAGIEVIIDVVFNHTAEGGPDGPTLSFRGLDAPAYYLHTDRGHLADITGCGNTLEAASPTVVRLVTDSLRYWTQEMGVDGFRFDLASTLGRPHGGKFDRDSTLLTAITTDPVLSRCKLIAEPWDATGDGYRVGDFGAQWAEWNGRYRDTVRDFWRGATGVRDLAYRLSGSSDLYDHNLRRPWQSINFITAHDGFTLRDLVSYNEKHNDANGEDNRDGTNDNRSWNHGVEGDTADQEVRALRARQARNLFATLLLSTGTPMFTAGDEFWRTQHGNNNAYCLDDETSWFDWTPDGRADEATAMLAFARRVIRLRAASPALRQPEFFEGRTTPTGKPDLIWFRPDGEEFDEADWFEDRRTLGMWIDGSNSQARNREGELVPDHSWLLWLHAGAEPVKVILPGPEYGKTFKASLDTSSADGSPAGFGVLEAKSRITLPARSLLLLRAPRTGSS